MGSNPMHVSGIAVIGIYVCDLQAARKFYVEELGLEDKGDMGPGCILTLGESSFYLEDGREKNPENQKMDKADITICFDLDSVKLAYEAVLEKDILVVMAYKEYGPDYAVFMIADPDGNIIELAGKP